MGRDWGDDIWEPSDSQVYLGCKPYEPKMDATSGSQRPDGTYTFLRRARKVKNCVCGSGKAGFVQPGTALVCEPCSKSGQDYKLPRVITPPRHDAPEASQKSPEGVKPLTRRERRKRKFSQAS